MGLGDLSVSSAHILSLIPNFKIVDRAIKEGNFLFLPYIKEDKDRKMDLYTNPEPSSLVVFSHNDIQGIQFGSFKSEVGFEIPDIEAHCRLFLNGHIHNESQVSAKVVNVGNVIGQNFSEDASKYAHGVTLLDISGSEISAEFLENPFAFNFYKIDLTHYSDWRTGLKTLKAHSVLSVKCFQRDCEEVRAFLASNTSVDEYRLILVPDGEKTSSSIREFVKVDHIEEFKKYILDHLGEDSYILKELQEICK